MDLSLRKEVRAKSGRAGVRLPLTYCSLQFSLRKREVANPSQGGISLLFWKLQGEFARCKL